LSLPVLGVLLYKNSQDIFGFGTKAFFTWVHLFEAETIYLLGHHILLLPVAIWATVLQ
jgi:hypothetical protein